MPPRPCLHDPQGKMSCWRHGKQSGCDKPITKTEIPESTFTAYCTPIEGEIQSVHCAGCGSKNFEIFSGLYWTGIRCSSCGIESTIHDG